MLENLYTTVMAFPSSPAITIDLGVYCQFCSVFNQISANEHVKSAEEIKYYKYSQYSPCTQTRRDSNDFQDNVWF